MSLVAPVKNGEVQDVTKLTSSEETKTSNSSLDKQAFLQLLVAQMKYQDPLEPTSNTEYISQLATFSELEEMQNMRSSIDLQRASSLVGQEVFVKTTDAATGSTDYVHGKVDYVIYENGKAYLSIDGNNYPLDDLDSIYNGEYTEAYNAAFDWTVALNKLPALDKLTVSDEDDVMDLKDTYDNMTDYQKTFLTAENREKIENYVKKMELLIKAKEALEESQKDDVTEKTEGTDEVTGTGSSEESDETTAVEEATKAEDTTEAEEVTEPEDTSEAEEIVKTEEAAETVETSESEEADSVEGEESNETAE